MSISKIIGTAFLGGALVLGYSALQRNKQAAQEYARIEPILKTEQCRKAFDAYYEAKHTDEAIRELNRSGYKYDVQVAALQSTAKQLYRQANQIQPDCDRLYQTYSDTYNNDGLVQGFGAVACFGIGTLIVSSTARKYTRAALTRTD